MERIIRSRLLQNILFWLFFAGFPFFMNLGSFGLLANAYTDIQFYVDCAVLGYFHNFVLMPLFFDRKRYLVYALTLLMSILAYTFFSIEITKLLSPNYSIQSMDYIYTLTDYVQFIAAFASGRLVRIYIFQTQRINELEEERLQTEIDFLRSQINPHLLFNTLNTVYSFSLEQSHKTPELILKLSDMMRYMLYKTNGQWVLLEQEITYLQNYVNLQKLRIEGRGQVEFEIQGDPGKLLLAPMLLISYVENAFKHSMDSKSEGIDISLLLRIYERQLYLEIKNNYEPGNPIPDKENGIGLQNTEKRLKLIYPNRHYLSIYPENNYFVVKLRLELHDDPDADY